MHAAHACHTRRGHTTETRDFELCFIPDPSISAPTEIFLGTEVNYPRGATVECGSSSPASSSSSSSSSSMQLVCEPAQIPPPGGDDNSTLLLVTVKAKARGGGVGGGGGGVGGGVLRSPLSHEAATEQCVRIKGVPSPRAGTNLL